MTVHIVKEPTVIVLAETNLCEVGLAQLKDFVRAYRPCCTPFNLFADDQLPAPSDVEILPEIAGRSCYYSFGKKIGRKNNQEYLAHALGIGHMSIAYHSKMTFFIAGVSRRVGEEFIRHYVGAERSQEGSPSKESTRYTEHTGWYVNHPGNSPDAESAFQDACVSNRTHYLDFLQKEKNKYQDTHGRSPKGLARKRIYERAAGILNLQAATSFVWTVNPVSLAKMLRERCPPTGNPSSECPADLEFQRLACLMRDMALDRWPNVMRPLLGME